MKWSSIRGIPIMATPWGWILAWLMCLHCSWTGRLYPTSPTGQWRLRGKASSQRLERRWISLRRSRLFRVCRCVRSHLSTRGAIQPSFTPPSLQLVLALRCQCSHPNHPVYALFGFRVFQLKTLGTTNFSLAFRYLFSFHLLVIMDVSYRG